MADRFIPHEEQCPVCGTVSGCENKYCRKPYLTLCENPECKVIWDAGTIHQWANDAGILACCGLHKSQTKPGDRMTSTLSKVTCAGANTKSDPEDVVE